MRSKNPEYFRAIESFIDDYETDNDRSPSNLDISIGTGLSTATVSRYMQTMRESGDLYYDGCRNIYTRKRRKYKTDTVAVPVLGAVSCGLPKFAEENIEEYVRLPISLFGRGEFYILRANGDSMIDAGIEDGDLILIRVQNYADPGQIVVALMEDEATLKRYYPEPKKQRIRLHPENEKYEDIYVSECVIQGVAVKVMKDL